MIQQVDAQLESVVATASGRARSSARPQARYTAIGRWTDGTRARGSISQPLNAALRGGC